MKKLLITLLLATTLIGSTVVADAWFEPVRTVKQVVRVQVVWSDYWLKEK